MGSYERETCRAAGAAQSLVQPFLDNQASIDLTFCRTRKGLNVLTDVVPIFLCPRTAIYLAQSDYH